MRKSPRHIFRFKIQGDEDEKAKILLAKAKVRLATRAVELILTANDVKRSMKLKGVGNTQTCSMAVCAKRQADAFPHPVDGYIDWQYSRAYVTTKTNKVTGLPTHCVVYGHSDTIAELNDTRGGQEKLLAQLEANGPRSIMLYPISRRTSPKTRPAPKAIGSRSSRPASVGASLRFAIAQLGGVGVN